MCLVRRKKSLPSGYKKLFAFSYQNVTSRLRFLISTKRTEFYRQTSESTEKGYILDTSLNGDTTFGRFCLAKKIEIFEPQEIGYNFKIYQGKMQGELSSIKFTSMRNCNDFAAWKRVSSIYVKHGIRHASIDGLKAADICDVKDLTGIRGLIVEQCSSCGLLVGDYHPLGSFKSIIETSSPSNVAKFTKTNGKKILKSSNSNFILLLCVKAVCDIANGLSYLHIDITGTRGKPGIAHRNLSLDCIYMKQDGTFCIGSLEYAVCSLSGSIQLSMNELDESYLHYAHQCSANDKDAKQILTLSAKISSPFFISTINACKFSRDNSSETELKDEIFRASINNPAMSQSISRHSGDLDSKTCFKQSSKKSPNGRNGIYEDQQSSYALAFSESVQNFPEWWPVCGVKVGDPLNMAPEILQERINPFCLEAHKRADVYAFGIIIWEIMLWGLSNEEEVKSNYKRNSDSGNHSLKNQYHGSHPLPVPRSQRFAEETFLLENIHKNSTAMCRSNSSIAYVSENSPDRLSKINQIWEPRSLSWLTSCICDLEMRPMLPMLNAARVWLTECPAQFTASCVLYDVAKPNNLSNQSHKVFYDTTEVNNHNIFSRDDSGLVETFADDCEGAYMRVLGQLERLIQECWHSNPETRLSALRIKKNLMKITEDLGKNLF